MSSGLRRLGWWGPIVTGLFVATAGASAQTGTADGEWRFYNGDAGSTRYAPFDQINKDTVKDLTIAWRWKTENPGPRPATNYQATPLMVDGVLYVTSRAERDVVAIDAETGNTRWVWHTGPTATPRGSSTSPPGTT